ncbi:high affinity cAMP-specific and IBMX-insensitive 3',5'-cyclic phosphodiesterase 8A-like isoform X2 [Babylonia areolata]|uniref:high affinity cAMP-specific and IBMX-insensitive 3',5'-cyclic phosphodiesterase 8A-like isoform X2 n=1 Tax=Babylonia areolata TaxID=304850 RepID=UPI003FD32055
MADLDCPDTRDGDSTDHQKLTATQALLNGVADEDAGVCLDMQSTEEDIVFGPMRIPQKQHLTMLLVFSKEDAQCGSLCEAAKRLGHSCHLALTAEAALENFLLRHHDVVFIDRRSSKAFDADALCRSMQASAKSNDYSVMVAITKHTPSDKEEPSILPLLKAGFHKRFTETTNVGTCVNELHQLAQGEVRSQRKLRACGALVTALDNISDAVEITSEAHTIQYVNHMFERITGYSSEELVGTDSRQLGRSERNKDLNDLISAQTKKGKFWEGTYFTRRKSGDVIPYHCRVLPVLGAGSKVSQYVTVKSVSTDTFNQIANGSLHGFPRRRESVARMHSSIPCIEAPITKVINMINAAQETSSLTVAQALEKVVEMLRTSELYAPYLPPQLGREEDPMTTDLVGGLVSQNMKRRMSGHEVQPHRASQPHIHPHPSVPPASLAQVPQHLRHLLDQEPTWDFDIIQLEEATNKRPLVYLGLKTFARFEACQFLGIEERVLVQWLQLMESNYHSANRYHNSTHAADVLQASAFFLECERTKMVMDNADCVACLIAAAVHDVDHPARTNAFLVNEANNPLAMLYNDLAVLENHHASLAFRLTHKDDTVNIFKNLSREDYLSLRKSIVDMVLATEMKQHFEHLSKFTNSINKAVLCMDAETTTPSETGPDGGCGGGGGGGVGGGESTTDTEAVINQLCSPENRTLIKRMLIKCADVSNPLRPWNICSVWAERIAEEYCSQTDEEKARGLPVVMPVFDRKTFSIPKSQTSFIDVFITDMFDAWDYYCDIPQLMSHLQDNYRNWEELEEKAKENASCPTTTTTTTATTATPSPTAEEVAEEEVEAPAAS